MRTLLLAVIVLSGCAEAPKVAEPKVYTVDCAILAQAQSEQGHALVRLACMRVER